MQEPDITGCWDGGKERSKPGYRLCGVSGVVQELREGLADVAVIRGCFRFDQVGCFDQIQVAPAASLLEPLVLGSVALADSEARQGGWYIELEIRLLWPVG